MSSTSCPPISLHTTKHTRCMSVFVYTVIKCNEKLKRVETGGSSTVEWACLWSWPCTELIFWRTNRHRCCKDYSNLLYIGGWYVWPYVRVWAWRTQRLMLRVFLDFSPSYLWGRISPLDIMLTGWSSVACPLFPRFSCSGVVSGHPPSKH